MIPALAHLPALGAALDLGQVLWFALGALAFEALRRNINCIVDAINRTLYITIRIHPDDEIHGWVYAWIAAHCMIPEDGDNASRHPSSNVNHTKQISALRSPLSNLLEEVWPSGRVPPRDMSVSTTGKRKLGNRWRDSKVGELLTDEVGNQRVQAMPAVAVRHALRYKGHTLLFKIYEDGRLYGEPLHWISVSVFLGSQKILDDFLATALEQFQEQDKGKLRIFTPEPRRHVEQAWTRAATKPGRPWDSIILDRGVKENILADAQEFLDEPEFYRERGLPYRRGYLLYGVPGGGKTSLIGALAAKLGVDIYVIHLGAKEIDDGSLQKLVNACPDRCILLIEDIDCAIQQRKPKEGEEEMEDKADKAASNEEEKNNGETGQKEKKREEPVTKVTMSGLLNALDGVASSEGRLLFCSTNHVDRIDPALCRPGRCDVWIEFKNATKNQLFDLFVRFYSPYHSSQRGATASEEDDFIEVTEEDCSIDKKQSKTDGPDTDLISLARRFAAIIPEDSVAVAALQGYLLRHKRRPQEAVRDAEKWVEDGFPQGPVSASLLHQ